MRQFIEYVEVKYANDTSYINLLIKDRQDAGQRSLLKLRRIFSKLELKNSIYSSSNEIEAYITRRSDRSYKVKRLK